MDGTQSLPTGSFDAIAVTGSLQVTRFAVWSKHLTPGGRLFVVIGDEPAMSAELITRTGDEGWYSESQFETVLRAVGERPVAANVFCSEPTTKMVEKTKPVTRLFASKSESKTFPTGLVM